MNWRKGPPPSIGWWPASVAKDLGCVRWWNGRHWSLAAWADTSVAVAASSAQRSAANYRQIDIEWTDRPAWWPERSKT
jgi:hypothetical protein